MNVSARNRAKSAAVANVSAQAVAPSWAVQALVVFGVALAMRAVHFLAMRDTLIYQVLIGDSWQYDQWAQRIAGGEWIGTEVFYQTPLYPYFLGVIYALFGHHVWIVRIAQAVLGALACTLLARTGSRFFNHHVGWAAGLLLAVYPPAIFFDGILQKAALDLVLMCVLLWLLSRAQERVTASVVLATGATLGALILNRENAWVLFPVLVAWLLWLVWQQPLAVRLRPLAVLVAGMALVLLPVGLRNLYVGGEFLLTTSQMGPNFFIGNHRGASGQYVSLRADRGDPRYESADARILAEQDVGRALTPGEISKYWMDRSRRDIASDPAGWVRLLARKWFLTWNQVEVIDGEGIRVHLRYSPVIAAVGTVLNFGVLCTLATVGLWLTRHDWRRLWVLYGLTLAFALAVTLFFVFARYRYPLVPMVVMFAGAGVIEGWRIVRDGAAQKRRELWIAVAIALPVAVATCWPQPALHGDEVTYFSVGTALSDEGRFDEAIEQLHEAVRIKPTFTPAYNNLGTAALGKGDTQAAERYLHKAVEISPGNASALANLAKLQLQMQDLDGAETSLRTALASDPYHLIAHQGLGQVELRRGNTKSAIEYMRKAVSIDRSSPQAHADLGMALMADGQLAAAVESLEQALALNPNMLLVANNLAWMLATGPDRVRNGARALELASMVCQRTGRQEPRFLDTLATAQAETGDFASAARTAGEAVGLAHAAEDEALRGQLESRRQLFLQGQTYRDDSMH